MTTWKQQTIEASLREERFGKGRAHYEILRSHNFVLSVRQPNSYEQAFDMQATTRAVGLELVFRNLGASKGGAKGAYCTGYDYTNSSGNKRHSSPKVQCDESLSLHEQHLTVAHEIGHHWLDVIDPQHTVVYSREDTENFCEYFAHQMVDGGKELWVPSAGQQLLFAEVCGE